MGRAVCPAGVRPSRTICSTARTDSPSFSIFFVEAELVLGIFQTEDGARMPYVDVLVAQTELDFSRKTQKAQMVGDSGAFLAQALGKALLGESVFVDQLLEAESHLDRVEVLALYVLDEGPSSVISGV